MGLLVGGQRDKRVNSDFHRIRRLPPYVFEQVNKLKAQARARGDDIIDFGMGNPDMPTPDHIVQKLVETVRDPRTSRYSASRGIQGLRRAQGAYYERRFGVTLNPETQIVATLGSKEGFANMAQAITGPGDVILVPNPTYPIHEFGFIMSGGVIRHLPASTNSAFMTSLSRAVKHSVPKPLALVLNYPANPTAVVADLDFYREVVGFARKHDLIVLSDLAYAEIYFDGEPPPSILQVPGAMDLAVEFTTLSKTYAMPGWRMGFAVGNERLIGALTRVKSYLDYGAFTPVQVAAAAALNGPQDCIDEIRGIYRRRRDCLVDSLYPRRLADPVAGRDHVRLGADPGDVLASRFARIFQDAARAGLGRRLAWRRLRRIWRRLCPYRARRKRAAHPPGRAQYPKIPRRIGEKPAQRHSTCV